MDKKWIVVMILLLSLVIFTAQNSEVVEIKFIFWSAKVSRAIVIFSMLTFGIIIGWVASSMQKEKEEEDMNGDAGEMDETDYS